MPIHRVLPNLQGESHSLSNETSFPIKRAENFSNGARLTVAHRNLDRLSQFLAVKTTLEDSPISGGRENKPLADRVTDQCLSGFVMRSNSLKLALQIK